MNKQELKEKLAIECTTIDKNGAVVIDKTPAEMIDWVYNIMQEAIADHEAKQWHYIPELPECNGRKVLVEHKSLDENGKKHNMFTEFDYSVSKHAIRWRELPAPYQPKEGGEQ